MKNLEKPHWFICSRCGHEQNEVINLHRRPCLECSKGHYFDQYDVSHWDEELLKYIRIVAKDKTNEKLQKGIAQEIADNWVGLARETAGIHERMIPKCHDMIKKCREHDYEA